MTFDVFLQFWAHPSREDRVRVFVRMAFVALLLVGVDPLNAFGDTEFRRFGLWFLCLCMFGFGILPLMSRRAQRWSVLSKMRFWSGGLVFVFFAAIPLSLCVYLLDHVTMMTWLVASRDHLPPWVEKPGLESRADLYRVTLGIAILSAAIGTAPAILRAYRQSGPSAAALRPGIQFLSRLPQSLGTDLVCLQMEDHYLRAFTKRGDALILLRFRDALAELSDYPGMQVHRSWWVALAEVSRVSKASRRLELVMSNDARVPVSSSYRAEVERIVTGADV